MPKPFPSSKMIALDYDGTYTADPEMWLAFVILARQRGHNVLLVTMRYPNEGNSICEQLKLAVNGIIFTSRKAKVPYMEALCVKVDMWIDDQPRWLLNDSAFVNQTPSA